MTEPEKDKPTIDRKFLFEEVNSLLRRVEMKIEPKEKVDEPTVKKPMRKK